jgi:hypothetical protein
MRTVCSKREKKRDTSKRIPEIRIRDEEIGNKGEINALQKKLP